MRKLTAAAIVAALAVATSAPAIAAPGAPINKATTEKGTYCVVPDANGVLYDDFECTYHVVLQLNKDGSVKQAKYQDHGNLPAEAVHPTTPYTDEYDTTLYGAPATCSVTVSPSGVQNSNCHTN